MCLQVCLLGSPRRISFHFFFDARLSGKPPSLETFYRSSNITGSIPSELGLLTNTPTLSIDLRVNELVGAIPSELGLLSNLVVLSLERNQLSGPVPGEICELSDDSLQAVSVDCPAVDCGCGGGTEEGGGICVCPEQDGNEQTRRL
jgi:hypothetical protein